MRPARILVCIAAISIIQGAKGDEPKDADTIQGTWGMAAAELGGKPFPEELRKSIEMTLKGTDYIVSVGRQPDRGTFKLDPLAKPKAIDVTGVEGPNKGRTLPAIYELDGETLRICYDLDGKTRPKEFKSVEGSRLFLVTYKRKKP